MKTKNAIIPPPPRQPAGRLSPAERKRLRERFPERADAVDELDAMTNEQLADEVFELMKGTPNEGDNRPRYAIHGVGLMERFSYRAWSRRQLIVRLLTLGPVTGKSQATANPPPKVKTGRPAAPANGG